MVNVRIYVTYKESVFDPQGDTIKNAIHALGHDEVENVKVGKFFDVVINPETYRYEVLGGLD